MQDPHVDLFKTRDHVTDFDRYVVDFAQRSATTRARGNSRLDIAYGAGANEKLDLFLPADAGGSRPVHLFVHGGYWRMFSKDDFSFVADTVVAAGGIAAIVDYDLMPAVRMQTIVAQVRKAAAWLVTNASSFGGDADRLSISGHSAGAHLCCSLLETDSPVAPQRALLLSGIYDLAPLQTSFLQPVIALNDVEVARFSPISYRYRPGSEVTLLVGARETAPFHSQADAMRTRFAEQGVVANSAKIGDGNHMSIALDLADATTDVGRALIRMLAH